MKGVCTRCISPMGAVWPLKFERAVQVMCVRIVRIG